MREKYVFSLKDLMVAITLIGICFALLMPLVQAARDVARQMSCSNNFKQIGLAIHNYHSAYRRCPGAMCGTPANQYRLSGLIALTPFIESSPFWDRVSNPLVDGGVLYPPMGPVPWDTNYPPWSETYASFRCPTDTSRKEQLGRTNYAFSVGDRIEGLYKVTPTDEVRGFFAPRVVMRFANITDGLANTMMMAEIGTKQSRKLQGQFALEQPKSLADAPNTCSKVVDPSRPGRYAPSVTLSKLGRGGAYADGAGGYALVHTILPPNSPSCAIGSLDPLEGIFSAGSYHPDGCHILMGDGAVIFITDSIEAGLTSASSPRSNHTDDGRPLRSPYGLWGALGTPKGEEIIEEQVCE